MERQIEKYVELIITKGINIQKGQILVISSPVETYDFTRKLVEKAYQLGASEVVIHWSDEVCGNIDTHMEQMRFLISFLNGKRSQWSTIEKRGCFFKCICS